MNKINVVINIEFIFFTLIVIVYILIKHYTVYNINDLFDFFYEKGMLILFKSFSNLFLL